jgi:two-component system, OmpR family, aerobic respiration control sensor histidine kinase ArcB
MQKYDLNILMNLVPFNIYIKDINGFLVYANQNQIHSYNRRNISEIIGKSEYDLCEDHDDAKKFRLNDEQVVLSGQPMRFEETFLIRNHRKMMLSYKTPIKNEYKEVIGIFGISIDITEQKNLQDSLEHEKCIIQNTLESIISRLPGHVYWLDKNNIFLGCNDLQAKDAGLKSPKDIIGKTNHDLPWKNRADSLNELNNKVMLSEKEYAAEEISTLADGREEIYYSIKTPLYDENNQVNGILGISLNITEKKQLENDLKLKNIELEKMLSKYKNFVLNQEHDIRTPYSGIVALTEHLIHEAIDDGNTKLADMLKHILHSGQAQLAYQNSLLDTIYLFYKETQIYHRRFDLKLLIEETKNIFDCVAITKKLNYELDFNQKNPHFLVGDCFRLQQILVRLLDNAIKFTEPGDSIYFRCNYKLYNESIIILIIDVEDTGIGFDEKQKETIFEPFQRLSLSYIGKHEGRGTGLSFVKKMVDEIVLDNLHAEIDVKSVVGVGSIFRVMVPFRISLDQNMLPEPLSQLA